tara:strand:+ start:246 stop:626 length:381 start_codon:yes stop_codon:yes gene_type:complete
MIEDEQIENATEEQKEYVKGNLNDPDGLTVFLKGGLKDSLPYVYEDSKERIEGRYPKKVIITKAVSKVGNDYYTVYAEIGCLYNPLNNGKAIKTGNIEIDGKKKRMNIYDNGSYYGIEIREDDESN